TPGKLDRMLPWGRTFEGDVRMFALADQDLKRSTIDCAAGPSSFGAEMNRRGRRVICVDPIYQFSADEIRGRVEAVRETMMEQLEATGTFLNEHEIREAAVNRRGVGRAPPAFAAQRSDPGPPF